MIKFCRISLCLLFMMSLSAYPMDAHGQATKSTENPFALCTLKRYIIGADDSLFRVVFPGEAFGSQLEAIPNVEDALEAYFQDGLPLVSFNKLYKIIFLEIYSKYTTQLESQWLIVHKTLHDFMVAFVIPPALDELSLSQDLGEIDNPGSVLRQLMEQYVDFFFRPLIWLDNSEYGTSPFNSDNYTSDLRCPPWLRKHLAQAVNEDEELMHFILCVKLDELKTKLNLVKSGQFIGECVTKTLALNNFSHSLDSFLAYLLTLNNIDETHENYSTLKKDLCLLFISKFKSNADGVSAEAKSLYIRDDIYDSVYWKINRIIKSQAPVKRTKLPCIKSKICIPHIDLPTLTDIINCLMSDGEQSNTNV